MQTENNFVGPSKYCKYVERLSWLLEYQNFLQHYASCSSIQSILYNYFDV